MKRNQRGHIYEASNSFYVQYFEEGKRVSRKLCDRDAEHFSTTCLAVTVLRDEFMLTINRPQKLTGQNIEIVAYWDSIYLPFLKSSKKPSTVDGYVQIWNQHLKNHFDVSHLRDYATSDATEFLTSLVREKYGRRTVAHIKSLASGLFKHAKATGRIPQNPWTGSISLVKPKAPAETQAYTLAELMDIINNKLTRTDARLVVCLAGLMGLRPSEIIGLDWSDVDIKQGTVRIRQAVVRGKVGTTKTDVDEQLPMIEPLRGFMRAWWEESKKPDGGWVFPNESKEKPINVRDYTMKVLRPSIGKKDWKSLYAFRRGAASILTQLTGNPIAASQLLRHKNISVTMTAYIKADRTALLDGLKLVEQKLLQSSK